MRSREEFFLDGSEGVRGEGVSLMRGPAAWRAWALMKKFSHLSEFDIRRIHWCLLFLDSISFLFFLSFLEKIDSAFLSRASNKLKLKFGNEI